jgi:hypothetical protein
LCPSEPETWNKYNDTDGCPDTRPWLFLNYLYCKIINIYKNSN